MPVNVNKPLEIAFCETIKNDSFINDEATPNSEVWSLQFSPSGSILVWQSEQTRIKVMRWQNSNNNELNLNRGEEFFFDETEHSCNKPTMTSARILEYCYGETIWSLAFGTTKSCTKHKRLLHKPKTTVKVNTRFLLSKQDEYLILAVGLVTGKIKIYQVDEASCNLKLLFNIYDHKGIVNDLKFTKDGSLLLASASRDGTIKLWNMFDDGNLYKTLNCDGGRFYACDWSPTDSLLCGVGSNKKAIIWNTETYNVN